MQPRLVIGGGRLLADSTPLELASRSRYHQAVTLYSDDPWIPWRWRCCRAWRASRRTPPKAA